VPYLKQRSWQSEKEETDHSGDPLRLLSRQREKKSEEIGTLPVIEEIMTFLAEKREHSGEDENVFISSHYYTWERK